MGKKSKKPRQANTNHHDYSSSHIQKNLSVSRKGGANGTLSSPSKKKQGKAKQQQVKPVIPFRPCDRILLVGEGDFSFALSLVQHHKCRYVTATCYDSEDELHRKYPQTRDILNRFLSHNGNPGLGDEKPVSSSQEQALNSDEIQGDGELKETGSSEWEGFSPPISTSTSTSTSTSWENVHPSSSHSSSHPASTNGLTLTSSSSFPTRNSNTNVNLSFHHSISATNLPAHKPLRRLAPYNKIIFNFPHVGGLSTDVNRQVRANQELLVKFFKSCKGLLASRSDPAIKSSTASAPPSSTFESDHHHHHDDFESGEERSSPRDEEDEADAAAATTTGQILLTLFEGEPYSLWNVRDLARHCGLRVVTSYRFPWEMYPGYRHARTLGAIVKKGNIEVEEADGDREQGKKRKRGAWKGEEREARGYVFEMVDDEKQPQPSFGKKRRRNSNSDSDSAD